MDMIMWSPGVTLDAIERQVIEKCYQFFKQNKTATANALGIAIRTLENKLERYRLEDEKSKEGRDHYERGREDFLRRSRSGHEGDVPPGALQPSALTDIRPASPGRGDGQKANQGDDVESSAKTSKEHPMSVPVGKEVQGMLPPAPPPRRKRSGSSASIG